MSAASDAEYGPVTKRPSILTFCPVCVSHFLTHFLHSLSLQKRNYYFLRSVNRIALNTNHVPTRMFAHKTSQMHHADIFLFCLIARRTLTRETGSPHDEINILTL